MARLLFCGGSVIGASRVRAILDMIHKQVSAGGQFDALIVCGELDVSELVRMLDAGETIPLPVYFFTITELSYDVLRPLPIGQVVDIMGFRAIYSTDPDTSSLTEQVDFFISDSVRNCNARYVFCTSDKYIVYPTEENKPKAISLAPGGSTSNLQACRFDRFHKIKLS